MGSPLGGSCYHRITPKWQQEFYPQDIGRHNLTRPSDMELHQYYNSRFYHGSIETLSCARFGSCHPGSYQGTMYFPMNVVEFPTTYFSDPVMHINRMDWSVFQNHCNCYHAGPQFGEYFHKPLESYSTGQKLRQDFNEKKQKSKGQAHCNFKVTVWEKEQELRLEEMQKQRVNHAKCAREEHKNATVKRKKIHKDPQRSRWKRRSLNHKTDDDYHGRRICCNEQGEIESPPCNKRDEIGEARCLQGQQYHDKTNEDKLPSDLSNDLVLTLCGLEEVLERLVKQS